MRYRKKKNETPHETLMRHSSPVNRAAARAFARAGIDDTYYSGLKSRPGEIENETFIKFYRIDEYLSLFNPRDAKGRQNTIVDYTGERAGRLKVMGFYLPDFPEDVEPEERYKLYEQQPKRCHECGQVLPQRSWGPSVSEKIRPKLRWTCKCDCGNYVVRNNKTIMNKRDPNDCCSACDPHRNKKETK